MKYVVRCEMSNAKHTGVWRFPIACFLINPFSFNCYPCLNGLTKLIEITLK